MTQDSAYSILLVDDDEDNLAVLEFQLRGLFKKIYSASNGQSGIDSFLLYKPEIVLTDIRMPNMDGLEMSKLIREHNKQTVIIVLSAYDDSDMLREAISAGVNNYLLKPFDRFELRNTIEKSFRDINMLQVLHDAESEVRSEKYTVLEEQYRQKTEEIITINNLLQKEIQDRKLIEANLIHARAVADSANSAKDRFIANMSHELRTPLNGVLGLTSLLFKTGLEKKQYEYIKYIQLSARTLLSIVNDILDMSSIEAGKFRIGKTNFNIRSTIEYVMFPIMLNAKKNNIQTERLISHDVPENIFGDEERLKQVLTNMLSNALKFTQEGKIQITVSVKSTMESVVYLEIAVKDTGIGISQEGQKKIFERFVQVDDSPTRKYGGTGLGLYITQQITETLGGNIRVESVLGKGSTFTVILPFELGEKETGAESREESIEEFVKQWDIDRNRYRILVCEDNDINRQMVFDFLSEFGYRIDAAATGREVLELCSETIYDLILLDIQFPDFSGYDLCRILREPNSINRNTAIVALTAHSSTTDEEKCIVSGMDGFLSKPIDLDRLEAEIVLYLKRKRKGTEAGKAGKISDPPISFDIINRVVKGSKENLVKYLRRLLDYYPEEFEQLRIAVQARDVTKMKQLSHRMKSTFGNFKASRVVTGLQAIYDLADTPEDKDIDPIFRKIEAEVHAIDEFINQYITTLERDTTQ